MGHRCTLRLAFVRTGFVLIRQGGRQPKVRGPKRVYGEGGGLPFARVGLPRLDWSIRLQFNPTAVDWVVPAELPTKGLNRSVLPFLPVQLDIAKLRCILFGGAGHSMPGINEPLFMDSATQWRLGIEGTLPEAVAARSSYQIGALNALRATWC